MSYACGNDRYKGFNLIGNPFPFNITKGANNTNILNESLLEDNYCILQTDGTWIITNDGTEIAPGTAFLVQAKAAASLIIAKTAQVLKATEANYDNIWFTVKNDEFTDVACVEFKEGHGFNKIDHHNDNAPMLYIHHNGEDFASANMNSDTKEFNLNFKAKTIGRYTISYEARFIVNLQYSEIAGFSDDSFVYQNGSDIIVYGEGELQVFDVMGRLVMKQYVNGVETCHGASLQNGVYIFRLNDKTPKIVVR